MALHDRTGQGILSTSHTKPEKSTRLTQLDAQDSLQPHCTLCHRPRSWQSPPKRLSFTCLAKENPSSVILVARGSHVVVSLDEYDGTLPVSFDKLLQVMPGGGKRAVSANMQAVNSWDQKQPRTDWQPHQCLRLIRAQGHVVRREARTLSRCQFDGVESEADMFKLSVEHHHVCRSQ